MRKECSLRLDQNMSEVTEIVSVILGPEELLYLGVVSRHLRSWVGGTPGFNPCQRPAGITFRAPELPLIRPRLMRVSGGRRAPTGTDLGRVAL